MRIAAASDHAGCKVREELVHWLRGAGHDVEDLGPFDGNPVDYPDYAAHACRMVAKGGAERAVLVCGSGIGMAISANKIPGCRAAVLHNEYEAEMFRRHNDGNVVCFGARQQGPEIMERCLGIFLATPFDGGRHERRVEKIARLYGQEEAGD